jgi:hypothetical protein
MEYKFWFYQQNAEQNHDINIENELFWKCGKVTVFGDNCDKSNSMHEGSENRVNSGNVS